MNNLIAIFRALSANRWPLTDDERAQFVINSECITLETLEADAYGPEMVISVHENTYNGYDREIYQGWEN